jgi:hypothetical protein
MDSVNFLTSEQVGTPFKPASEEKEANVSYTNSTESNTPDTDMETDLTFPNVSKFTTEPTPASEGPAFNEGELREEAKLPLSEISVPVSSS